MTSQRTSTFRLSLPPETQPYLHAGSTEPHVVNFLTFSPPSFPPLYISTSPDTFIFDDTEHPSSLPFTPSSLFCVFFFLKSFFLYSVPLTLLGLLKLARAIGPMNIDTPAASNESVIGRKKELSRNKSYVSNERKNEN